VSSTNRNLVLRPRDGRDFYRTPEWCVRELYGAGLHLPDPTLDPCAGDGALLVANETIRGVELDPVLAATSDRVANGDGLASDWHGEHVLMNPPYGDALMWCQKAVGEAFSCAALLRLGFLASQKRRAFLVAHPPEALVVLSRRPAFKWGRTDSADYAWFVWGSGPRLGADAPCLLRWIGGRHDDA